MAQQKTWFRVLDCNGQTISTLTLSLSSNANSNEIAEEIIANNALFSSMNSTQIQVYQNMEAFDSINEFGKTKETAIIASAGHNIICMKTSEFDLLLRPIELSDAESIAFHGNNPNVSKFLRSTFPSPYTIDDALYFINNIVCREPDWCRAIALHDSDSNQSKLIGIISLVHVEEKSAELGYWLSQQFWGKGIMTETVRVFISTYVKKCFPSLIKLTAKVVDENILSTKTLEKSGFVIVESLKGTFSRQNNIYNELVMALDLKQFKE